MFAKKLILAAVALLLAMPVFGSAALPLNPPPPRSRPPASVRSR